MGEAGGASRPAPKMIDPISLGFYTVVGVSVVTNLIVLFRNEYERYRERQRRENSTGRASMFYSAISMREEFLELAQFITRELSARRNPQQRMALVSFTVPNDTQGRVFVVPTSDQTLKTIWNRNEILIETIHQNLGREGTDLVPVSFRVGASSFDVVNSFMLSLKRNH